MSMCFCLLHSLLVVVMGGVNGELVTMTSVRGSSYYMSVMQVTQIYIRSPCRAWSCKFMNRRTSVWSQCMETQGFGDGSVRTPERTHAKMSPY